MKLQELERVLVYNSLIEGEHSAFTVATQYIELKRLSKRLTHIDVLCCNGTKYTKERSYNYAVGRVYNKIDEIINPHGLHYFHQKDPRGLSLHVSRFSMNDVTYQQLSLLSL